MSTTKQRPGLASSHDLLAAAEAMLPEISAAADEADNARRVPDWLAQRLNDAGFFHLLTGREHGGMDANPVAAAKVIETLSTASPSVGWVTMILATASFWTVRMAPEEVRREIFAGVSPGEIQPTVIAGTLVPHGRAVRAEGGWLLNGQWPFASGCHHATWMPTAAWLHDQDGPIRDANGAPEWRVFHLPASDCTILDTWYTSGLREPAATTTPWKTSSWPTTTSRNTPSWRTPPFPTNDTSMPPSTCRCSRRWPWARPGARWTR